VRDAVSIRRRAHERFVDVVWVEVAGDPGEQIHVRLAERFGEADPLIQHR